MATDEQRIAAAAAKYGRSLDHIARRYVNPVTGEPLSGEALIRKTVKGESGGRGDAVSSAGARGWGQFMPGTRADVIRKYGIDPWRSPEEAVHAITLHMRGKLGHRTGPEGFNPGGGREYVDYILGQRVGAGSARAAGGSEAARGAVTGQSQVAASSGSEFEASGLSSRLRALAARVAAEGAGPAPIVSSGVAAPSFSPQVAMPEFYAAPQSQGVAAPAAELPLAEELAALAQGADQAATFGGRGGAPELAGDGVAAAPGGGGGRGAAPASIRPGGGYKGTEGVVQSLYKAAGVPLPVTSAKRNNTNPFSGSRSDHDNGNTDAYAEDRSNGQQPTREMDRTAYRLMRQLERASGQKPSYKMGQPIDTSRGVFTIKTDDGTYRVQVIYRGSGAAFGGNHLNHVHVGAKLISR